MVMLLSKQLRHPKCWVHVTITVLNEWRSDSFWHNAWKSSLSGFRALVRRILIDVAMLMHYKMLHGACMLL